VGSRATVERLVFGLEGSLARESSSGYVRFALKHTTRISIVASVSRYTSIQPRVRYLTGKNGFNVNAASSGTIQSVKFKMVTPRSKRKPKINKIQSSNTFAQAVSRRSRISKVLILTPHKAHVLIT
jgi:hypothetical protein